MSKNGRNALEQRLGFYHIKSQDNDYQAIKKSLSKYADRALDNFYHNVEATPETARFFPNRAAMEGAHQAQKNHWLEIFANGLTDTYLERATRIGNIHAKIGLDPQWYVGGYANILEQVITDIITSGTGAVSPVQRRKARLIGKLVKVALLDMDLALSTYFVRAEEQVRTTVVKNIGEALSKMATGDLTSRISGLPETYATLENDFNQAVETLGATIRQVTDAAKSISVGSSEIRAASSDLSDRTEQQAASLEETSAAMNQVTKLVKDTAGSAHEVHSAISEAHKQASEGGTVVERAIAAMSAIEKSSSEISQIIAVMDGIAFQTNLLALNAGVEAARAGDAGKGFAVVANEVRALAQRSADAAKDIKNLITNSSEQVGLGVNYVGETGDMLTNIVSSVGEINGLVSAISQAAENQASSLHQINQAISEMDKMTQQNAAMVEESTAAARAMAGEAESLAEMVARFQIAGGASSVKAPAARKKGSSPAPRSLGNLALDDDPDDWSSF